LKRNERSSNIASEGNVVVIEQLEGRTSRGGPERGSASVADVDIVGSGVGSDGAGSGCQNAVRTGSNIPCARGKRDVATGDGATAGIGDVAGTIGNEGSTGRAGNVVGSNSDDAVVGSGLQGEGGSGNVAGKGNVVIIEELEGRPGRGSPKGSSANIGNIDGPRATSVSGNSAGCGEQNVIGTAADITSAGGQGNGTTRNGTAGVGDVTRAIGN